MNVHQSCLYVLWSCFIVSPSHGVLSNVITERSGLQLQNSVYAFIHLHLISEERTLIFISAVSHSGLTVVAPLKPGVGQDIAMHASPAARNFILVLIYFFPKKS